jgi:hypothetical protein
VRINYVTVFDETKNTLNEFWLEGVLGDNNAGMRRIAAPQKGA